MTNLYMSTYDKKILLERLPKCNLELFYDKLIHNKVFLNNLTDKTDVYFLIPAGIKCLLWYTYYKNNNVCILIQLNKYYKVDKMYFSQTCFSNNLAINDTIILGYQCENTANIEQNYGKYKQKHFACTNILRYKGCNTENYIFSKKLNIFSEIFSNDIKQISYNKYSLIVALPIIVEKFDDIILESKKAAYNIYGIEYINYNKHSSFGISTCMSPGDYVYRAPQNKLEAIFKIKATLQNDIYNLYYYHNSSCDNFHNIALINNYKDSVYMNSLFRNIKENNNLDLLEESDDEVEFENISEDKYVDLNKSLFIRCIYNKKFRKWQPIEVVNTTKLINKTELYNIERTFNERKNINRKY